MCQNTYCSSLEIVRVYVCLFGATWSQVIHTLISPRKDLRKDACKQFFMIAMVITKFGTAFSTCFFGVHNIFTNYALNRAD